MTILAAVPTNSGLIFVIGMIVLATAVLIARDVARRLWRAFHPEAPKPATKKAETPIQPWMWGLVVVIFAVLIWANKPQGRHGPKGRPGNSPGLPIVAAVVGIPVLYLAGVIVFAMVRDYDRDVSSAVRKANAGDAAGAIEDLKALIAVRGPTAKRLNGLGMMLCVGGDWPEAARVFREAFALSPRLARSNLAISLSKAGEPAQAEEIIRPLIDVANPQAIYLINYAAILLDLGRVDEARVAIDRAESSIRNVRYIGPKSFKEVHLAEVAAVRDRIAGVLGSKTALNEWDEL